MKKTILFKKLIDTLYILYFILLIGIILMISFGSGKSTINQVNIEDWGFVLWFIGIVAFIANIIFLRGLYYLRKMTKFLLSKKYFSDMIIMNLKKSGNHFFVSGIIFFVLYIITWLNKLYEDKSVINFNNNLLIPLFLIIIGVFFIIQSNTLNLAKHIKKENELTI